MKPFSMTSAALICVALLGLTACSSDDDTATTTAAPGSSTAAPASAPAVPASDPADPASAPATGKASAASDKSRCKAANEAGETMKNAFVKAMGTGEVPPPATLKKILGDLDQKLTAESSTEGPSAVSAAMKKMAAEAAKAAGSANPIEAAANPDFEKAGADLTAACKAAGVKVNF